MKKWNVAATIAGLLVLSEAGSEVWVSNYEVALEMLYLKPYVNDLDFALESHKGISNLDSETVEGTGKYRFVHLGGAPSFRASVLKRDFFCDINVQASYIYLRANDSQSKSIHAPSELFATMTHNGFEIPAISDTSGKWNLNFQSGDLLFSDDFYFEGHLFTPAIGPTILIIDHKFKAHYYSGSTESFSIFDGDCRYTAFGLKVGVNYSYDLTNNFDVFAKVYGSLVTGNADTEDLTKRQLGGGEEITSLKLKSRDCLVVPGWHLAIGVLYHEWFCGYDFALRLGYEFMAWHGVSNPGIGIGTRSSKSSATFGLQGVTAGLQIRF